MNSADKVTVKILKRSNQCLTVKFVAKTNKKKSAVRIVTGCSRESETLRQRDRKVKF